MKSWKQLFITCVAAVQFITVIPIVAAEGNAAATDNNQVTNGTMQEGSGSIQGEVNGSADTDQDTDEVKDNVNDSGNNSTGKSGFADGEAGTDVLVLIADSNLMYQNGVEYKSPQPITVKKGVSYIALRSLVERFGLQVNYDSKTKETIIASGDKELRYKVGSSSYRVNGQATKMSGASYMQEGTFMVPITSAMQAFDMPYQWDNKTKRITIQLSAPPIAKFSVNEQEIFAKQTRVTVTNESKSPRGLQIVEEEWTGLQDYYDEPGTYTVSLRVRDERGEWSEPYSVTITVLKPNEPPVAEFQTDKTTYKMGEYIRYQDLSTDDDDVADLKREWTNNKPAFFEPGDHTVTLKVTDKYGLSSEVSHTITITSETLYTFDEFNKVYTPVGEVFPFDGGSALGLKLLQPELSENNRKLYRSNSPENVKDNGILYQDNVAGGARIFLHHINKKSNNLQLYILVKNISDDPADFYIEHYGLAGPSPYPQQTGKMSTVRYFESFEKNDKVTEMQIKPNETKVVIPELNQRPLKPNDTYTLYADFHGSTTLEYTVVALDADKDVLTELPNLQPLAPDEHIRGTYTNADRNFTVKEEVGKGERLVFADKINDKDLTGTDMLTYQDMVNKGNFGVLYRVKLEKVAPHTLIAFNSRSGSYSGAMLVNGQKVNSPNEGLIKGVDEASVVYRTGDYEESVEILFTPAAGSNMPVNLLFLPLPKPRS
ncbi:stalk domain-containing protein [Paenibacillus apiarius]|uniref:Stalk domain-containing protein n=1 Tax=Paenibacillus apiarius TaxID=46240 RepID=A0ABT4DN43_9BACL|nr:stalk domain-containing protein [Paenibacillus apiarius]MCY9517352.1 stalk domain-containing protein [Paenibacillus apiarius]MCY9518777.1 stalk domain-containing protein [Paenibacillus apiarius]MCY9552782.1 stalk domain-containing protein [Paenibacillus apiarius]MCY9556807.1 stalk domain-containing protein [Paenibacillus apiarius]MCY9684294.1 stalk domain-containing protein [Paenibacillus apiarius]